MNAKARAGLKRYQALKRKMAKAGLSTKGKKDALQRRWNAHEKSHGRKGGPKPKAAKRKPAAKRKTTKRKPRKRTTKTQTTTGWRCSWAQRPGDRNH